MAYDAFEKEDEGVAPAVTGEGDAILGAVDGRVFA